MQGFVTARDLLKQGLVIWHKYDAVNNDHVGYDIDQTEWRIEPSLCDPWISVFITDRGEKYQIRVARPEELLKHNPKLIRISNQNGGRGSHTK